MKETMRKILLLLSLCLAANFTLAQKITRNYQGQSLSSVLEDLDASTSRHEISFVYNDLEDFTVTCSLEHLSLDDALVRVVGFYPVRIVRDGDRYFVECTYKTERHLKGTIIDEQGRPLAFANIAILNPADSTLLSGGVSNEGGQFVVPYEQYKVLVRISYMGYKSIFRLCTQEDMGTIRLQRDSYIVKGVEVKGSRPVFKMKNGALVAPIENTVLSKLGDGIDVLQQLPFINGDGSSVNVVGRRGTPLVYINNRKMQDWNELRQLSSDMIKDVQIIMNPGVEYDSSVTAVIKITTLRPAGEGLGGYVAAEAGKGDDFKHNEWLFLNYRKRNTDVFVNGYLTNGVTRGEHEEEFSFTHHGDEYNAVGKGLEKNKYNRLNLYAGFNHQPSKTQYLSMQYMCNSSFRYDTHMALENSFIGGNENSLFSSVADGRQPRSTHSLSAYYSNQLSERLSLKIDGMYAHVSSDVENNETEDRTGRPVTVSTNTDTKSNVYALKAIMTANLGGGKLSFGMEEAYTKSHLNYNANQQGNDGIQGFDTESKQASTSFFADYQMNLGALFIDAGLRYDLIDFKYYKDGVKRNEDCKKYNHLFPNLSLSYQMGGFSASLGYKVTVERPSYSNLQSGVRYNNSYTYVEGNPLLRPSYVHDISVMMVYKNFLAVFDYYNIKDADYQVLNLYQDQPIIIYNQMNFSHHGWTVNLSYSPTISFWKPTFQIGVAQQDLEYLGRKYNTPCLYYSWKNVLSFPKNWTIVFNMDGYTKGDGQFYTSEKALVNYTDIYIAKRKANWTFRVGMKDIFHTFKDNGYDQIGDIMHRHWTDLRQQYVYVRCIYRFNSTKSKYRGGDAGTSELNRL